MVWCPYAWTVGSGGDFPTGDAARDDFFSMESPKNTLDYYTTSVFGTMLHEMHHIYVYPCKPETPWPHIVTLMDVVSH